MEGEGAGGLLGAGPNGGDDLEPRGEGGQVTTNNYKVVSVLLRMFYFRLLNFDNTYIYISRF